MEAAEGKKKMLATLVGCNYGGTSYELQGCINDVLTMHAVLLDCFSFAPGDVTVLTDNHEHGASVFTAGAIVKRALADMVARVAPGDVLPRCSILFAWADAFARMDKRSVLVTERWCAQIQISY